jgi:hypothetical protein
MNVYYVMSQVICHGHDCLWYHVLADLLGIIHFCLMWFGFSLNDMTGQSQEDQHLRRSCIQSDIWCLVSITMEFRGNWNCRRSVSNRRLLAKHRRQTSHRCLHIHHVLSFPGSGNDLLLREHLLHPTNKGEHFTESFTPHNLPWNFVALTWKRKIPYSGTACNIRMRRECWHLANCKSTDSHFKRPSFRLWVFSCRLRPHPL